MHRDLSDNGNADGNRGEHRCDPVTWHWDILYYDHPGTIVCTLCCGVSGRNVHISDIMFLVSCSVYHGEKLSIRLQLWVLWRQSMEWYFQWLSLSVERPHRRNRSDIFWKVQRYWKYLIRGKRPVLLADRVQAVGRWRDLPPGGQGANRSIYFIFLRQGLSILNGPGPTWRQVLRCQVVDIQ